VGLTASVNPTYKARQLGHGTVVFSKDSATLMSSKQDMSEMEKIEGKLSSSTGEIFSKKWPLVSGHCLDL
jgi:hypothetical protein